MGPFQQALQRIRGKSLQGGNQGIIAQFQARRQTGGYGGMFGGAIQQTVSDLRTTVYDAVQEAVPDDSFLKKGLVSNVMPHLRETRIIPPPPPETVAPATGMNVPAPIPPKNMQIRVEDVRPLNKKPLQYQVDDIRVLGGQYEINIH